MFGRKSLTDHGVPKPKIEPPSQRTPGPMSDRLFLLGALMSDLNEGDGPRMLMGAQQHLSGRDQANRQEKAFGGLLDGLGENAGGSLLEFLPQIGEYARAGGDVGKAIDLFKATRPEPDEFVSAKDGWYRKRRGAAPELVTPFKEDEKKPTIPAGMEEDPATGELRWRPGYVRAQSELSGTRREAVVSRPMPSRARAGGGGKAKSSGGLPPPPPGFVRPSR